MTSTESTNNIGMGRMGFDMNSSKLFIELKEQILQ